MTEMTGHDAEIGGHVGPKYARKEWIGERSRDPADLYPCYVAGNFPVWGTVDLNDYLLHVGRMLRAMFAMAISLVAIFRLVLVVVATALVSVAGLMSGLIFVTRRMPFRPAVGSGMEGRVGHCACMVAWYQDTETTKQLATMDDCAILPA